MQLRKVIAQLKVETCSLVIKVAELQVAEAGVRAWGNGASDQQLAD